MSLYLEQYSSDIQSLAAELRRNFNRMRELDTRIQKLVILKFYRRIEQCSDPYLRNINILSPKDKEFYINKIENLYKKVKEYSDSRNQLAVDSYDLVDKLICRMDSDLVRIPAGIETDKSKPANIKKVTKKTMKKGQSKKKRKMCSSAENFDVGGCKKKRKKQLWANAGVSSMSASECEDDAHPPALIAANHQNMYDMPVDPNEATYCLCRQVSYGEMVACDNPGCAIEWFHFPCVGLIIEPVGDWYCSRCTAERKLKKPKIVLNALKS